MVPGGQRGSKQRMSAARVVEYAEGMGGAVEPRDQSRGRQGHPPFSPGFMSDRQLLLFFL